MKLEQLVAVIVRCFLIYLMLIVGFQYVLLMGNFFGQSGPIEAVFYFLGAAAIYAVLFLGMYKAPLVARYIVPQSDSVVDIAITPAQIEVISLRVIGIWIAAESLAHFSSWLVNLGYLKTQNIYADTRVLFYGARFCVGVALALGAQGLSSAVRKLRGRDEV